MNFAYKIKEFIEGLFKMNKGHRINTIYTFFHPIKCYKYESDWFLDFRELCKNDKVLYYTYGILPQTLVYGLFAVLISKLRNSKMTIKRYFYGKNEQEAKDKCGKHLETLSRYQLMNMLAISAFDIVTPTKCRCFCEYPKRRA